MNFISAPDSGNYVNIASVDKVLEIDPFTVGGSSKVVFSEYLGFADSAAAVKALGDSAYVGYRIELVDNSTGEVIGTIENVDFTSSDLHPDKRASYLLSSNGITGETVRVRMTLHTNLPDAKTAMVNTFADQNVAMETSTQSVSLQPITVIKDYAFSQNYPNPFNPTTIISYAIPKDGQVTLKVYDVLGREVETLMNQAQKVGRYGVNFDGSRLASGVYFYRLV